MAYIPPTDEEIRRVNAFWEAVARLHSFGEPLPQEFDSVTQSLRMKVATHKLRIEQLACQHSSFVMQYGEPITCGDCHLPLKILSDVQIEDIKDKYEAEDSNSS